MEEGDEVVMVVFEVMQGAARRKGARVRRRRVTAGTRLLTKHQIVVGLLDQPTKTLRLDES